MRLKLEKGGENKRWWCPSCGTLLTKPPKIHDGERFHSYKCRPPMERVYVSVIGEHEPF